MNLPIDEMTSQAKRVLDETAHDVGGHDGVTADLAYHVLALAREVERLQRVDRRARRCETIKYNGFWIEVYRRGRSGYEALAEQAERSPPGTPTRNLSVEAFFGVGAKAEAIAFIKAMIDGGPLPGRKKGT